MSAATSTQDVLAAVRKVARIHGSVEAAFGPSGASNASVALRAEVTGLRQTVALQREQIADLQERVRALEARS